MNEIAISAKNISKCYKAFDDQRSRLIHAAWPSYTRGMQEIWALKDVNFEIKRGEAIAIIGRNGGGKSTLLEILTGTLTPTTGEVTVNGRVSALLELGSGFNPEYSGRDNVIINGLLLGLSKEDILNRFEEIEAFAEIGTAIDRPVKTYSSGMMMRLAFSVQVLCDPDILIIDEALSVGDFFFQQKCLNHIRKLCSKGVTLLFVSHDMGAVLQICQSAIFLKHGRIVSTGRAEMVTHKYFADDVNSKEHKDTSGLMASVTHENSAVPEMDCDTVSKGKLWVNPDLTEKKSSSLLSVSVLTENEMPSSAFRIGDIVKIIVEYLPNDIHCTHINVGLKDKYGKTCAATGTAQLGKSGLVAVKNAVSVHVMFSIKLLIEAGNYSIFIVMGYLQSPSHGERLDATPDIGPIAVNWNYEEHTPPFIGPIGLPTQVEYINVV